MRITADGSPPRFPESVTLTITYRQPDFTEHFRMIYVRAAEEIALESDDQRPKIDGGTLRNRIGLAAELVQLFIAEEMRARFGQRSTFRLEDSQMDQSIDRDSGSRTKCRLLECSRTAAQLRSMAPVQLYWTVVEAILTSEHRHPDAKYVAFLDFDRPAGNDGANFGCGDVALVDSAGLRYWPERWTEIQRTFASRERIDAERIPSEIRRRGRDDRGGVYGAGLGAALHELCHALDLAHSASGIMGLDFAHLDERFVLKTTSTTSVARLENAQLNLLKHHRWLNGRRTEAPAGIEIRNGCIACKDGIAFVELRKCGSSLFDWSFDVYKPTVWRPPEDAVRALNDSDDRDSVSLYVLSVNGVSRRIDKL